MVAIKADWLSVMAVAAYLTFFPVTIASLRGLRAVDPRAIELFRSYAATRRQILWQLRLPTSVPYLFSGFRVAAAAAVIGAIIGEQTAGVASGLGSAIINYNQYYISAPERLWATIVMCTARRLRVRRRGQPCRAPPDARPLSTRGGHAVTLDGTPGDAAIAPVVEVVGVGKVFGTGDGAVTALDSVDLTIQPREFVSLIGPSGCGKSTLLRLIGDLTSPTNGTIRINGKAPARARQDRDYGMVFQAPVLMDWRTIAKNIELPLEIMGFPAEERHRRAADLLRLVELEAFAERHPWELSGGMQQRVAIARALSFDPKLLLMDEPFGALDEMTRERMNAELMSIWRRTATTIVFVTHSIPEAVFLSTRVVVMSARPGRISGIVDIDLPAERSVETRESERYFELVTRVREALRRNEPADERADDIASERIRAEGLA